MLRILLIAIYQHTNFSSPARHRLKFLCIACIDSLVLIHRGGGISPSKFKIRKNLWGSGH